MSSYLHPYRHILNERRRLNVTPDLEVDIEALAPDVIPVDDSKSGELQEQEKEYNKAKLILKIDGILNDLKFIKGTINKSLPVEDEAITKAKIAIQEFFDEYENYSI